MTTRYHPIAHITDCCYVWVRSEPWSECLTALTSATTYIPTYPPDKHLPGIRFKLFIIMPWNLLDIWHIISRAADILSVFFNIKQSTEICSCERTGNAPIAIDWVWVPDAKYFIKFSWGVLLVWPRHYKDLARLRITTFNAWQLTRTYRYKFVWAIPG